MLVHRQGCCINLFDTYLLFNMDFTLKHHQHHKTLLANTLLDTIKEKVNTLKLNTIVFITTNITQY